MTRKQCHGMWTGREQNMAGREKGVVRKKQRERGPIAAGRDQCSSWEQWGWLIGHQEGGSGFALPNVIGKQKQNCSVSQKIWHNINHSFVMLITWHKHILTHVPFYYSIYRSWVENLGKTKNSYNIIILPPPNLPVLFYEYSVKTLNMWKNRT